MNTQHPTPDHIRNALGPCGLHCGACLAYAGGPIQEHAKALVQALGPNFAGYAERFAGMLPVFQHYPAFAQLLEFLAAGSCTGCRGAGCLFKECRLPHCSQERGVAFCFECAAFPCEEHGLPPGLAERWRGNNEIMRAKGLEAYYELVKERPRYP